MCFILICVGMFHIFLNIFDIFIYMFDMLIDISICLLIYIYIYIYISNACGQHRHRAWQPERQEAVCFIAQAFVQMVLNL